VEHNDTKYQLNRDVSCQNKFIIICSFASYGKNVIISIDKLFFFNEKIKYVDKAEMKYIKYLFY